MRWLTLRAVVIDAWVCGIALPSEISRDTVDVSLPCWFGLYLDTVQVIGVILGRLQSICCSNLTSSQELLG